MCIWANKGIKSPEAEILSHYKISDVSICTLNCWAIYLAPIPPPLRLRVHN